MNIVLLFIGIMIVPFFFIPGMDSRVPKELLGMGLSLFIIFVTFYKGEFKPFKNFWVFIFLGFGYLCLLFAPAFLSLCISSMSQGNISIFPNLSVSNLWMFKASYYFLVYTLLLISVASIEFKKDQIQKVFFLMALSGFLMSLYILIFQVFHLDQFFTLIDFSLNRDIPALDKPEIGGFMGQATVVAPFIAMLIPLALFIRKHLWAGCMILAVFVTWSKVGIGAMMIGLLVYSLLSKKKEFRILAVLIIVSIILIIYQTITANHIRNWHDVVLYITSQSNGRVDAWREMFLSFSTPVEGDKRTFFGLGPGSFPYFSSIFKNSMFGHAHNDLFEVMLNFGIPGLIFVLLALRNIIKRIISIRKEIILTIEVSLFILFLTSLGTFSLQITPNLFYALILLGLLHNEKFIREFDSRCSDFNPYAE